MEIGQTSTVRSQTRDPIHVVLIENDLAFAWKFKLALQEAGLQVLFADDGCGGLKLAASVLPDVIVLDLELPDMPACEVLARLKAHEAIRRIPVVILSNDSSTSSVQICRMLGAVDHLVKSPSSAAALAQLLPTLASGSS